MSLAQENLLGGVLPLLLIDTVKEREQHATSRRAKSNEPGIYLDEVASEVQMLLKDKHAAYIDTRHFEVANEGHDGLVNFFTTLHAASTPAIPLLRFDASPSRREALQSRARTHGVAIRLRIRTFNEYREIERLLGDLGIDDRSTDLVFDLFRLDGSQIDVSDCARRIDQLLGLGTWRRCSLIGGSFALPSTKIRTAPPSRIERREVAAYDAILKKVQSKQQIAFGDYGIVYPNASPAESSGGAGTWPVIRYSTKSHWLVWRSTAAHQAQKLSEYFTLAQSCATDADFMGAGFSSGDAFVEEAARGNRATPGGPSTWVCNDTSHHVVYTKHQFSNTLPRSAPISPSECKLPRQAG
jgi:hypothetical protein